jgi:hypothetical protein
VSLLVPWCPVDDRERSWIEDSMAWFRGQFGDGPLRQPVVLPTHEYFSPPFSGSDADVAAVVRRVSGYMGLPPDQVTVRFTDDYDHAAALAGLIPGASSNLRGAAGTYLAGTAGQLITIDRSVIRDPARLLAVIAHELGHVRLLGEGRIAADREDGEPLTDLVTVYLGMGILTANAAFDFTGGAGRPYQTGGWSARHLGYLTEQMFSYGLAAYAVMRGEPDPVWQKYLDTNPRVYCKHGLRYLEHSGWNGATGQAGRSVTGSRRRRRR